MLGLILQVEDEGILEFAMEASALLNALEEDERRRSCSDFLLRQFNYLCVEFPSSEAALLFDRNDVQLDLAGHLHLVRGVENFKLITYLTLKPLMANAASKCRAQGKYLLSLAQLLPLPLVLEKFVKFVDCEVNSRQHLI